MEQDIPAESLLGRLRGIGDPRRREGRIYPLWSVLGMLVLAAINGQKTLRSMWLWGCAHWAGISRPLGFTGQAHPPTYGTVWYLLSKLDAGVLQQALGEWGQALSQEESEGWSVDGKVLRGSRRVDPHEAALQVVTMAAQTLKTVVGEQSVSGGNQVAATVELLKRVPLDGKLVTADAGLLRKTVAKTILEQGGDYLGTVKGNEAELKQAVDDWLTDQFSPPGSTSSAGSDDPQ
jgi:hypothetical protein